MLNKRKSTGILTSPPGVSQFVPGQGINISESEIELLQNYDFPGNVRELGNIIERSLILQEGQYINPSRLIDLSPSPVEIANPQLHFINPTAKQISLAEMEKNFILEAFTLNNKNITRTATALDISLSTMKRKLKEYGLR